MFKQQSQSNCISQDDEVYEQPQIPVQVLKKKICNGSRNISTNKAWASNILITL